MSSRGKVDPRRRNWRCFGGLAMLLLAAAGCRGLGFNAASAWSPAAETAVSGASTPSQPTQRTPVPTSSNPAATASMQAIPERRMLASDERRSLAELAAPPVVGQATRPADVGALSGAYQLPAQPAQSFSQTNAGNSPASNAPRELSPASTHASNPAAQTAGGTTPASTALLVTGARVRGGPVRLAVFTDPQSFPSAESAAWTGIVEATDASLTVLCPHTGKLAVAAYQDLNNDGQLNRNRFGIPLEPYAFSNAARGERGPPTFAEAVVDTAAGSRSVQLVLPQRTP